jgi:hypothetical protein
MALFFVFVSTVYVTINTQIKQAKMLQIAIVSFNPSKKGLCCAQATTFQRFNNMG